MIGIKRTHIRLSISASSRDLIDRSAPYSRHARRDRPAIQLPAFVRGVEFGAVEDGDASPPFLERGHLVGFQLGGVGWRDRRENGVDDGKFLFVVEERLGSGVERRREDGGVFLYRVVEGCVEVAVVAADEEPCEVCQEQQEGDGTDG